MSLEIEKIDVSIGSVPILHDVSLRAPAGQVTALVGANGAGKTTLLQTVSGLVKPSKGQIRFGGEVVSGLPSHVVARSGIGHVPQGRMIIPGLSVEENLMIAVEQLGISASSTEGRQRSDESFTLFPRLAERRKLDGTELSGGEQQMLAVARALVTRPKLVMLDEPSLGLAPGIVTEIFETLSDVARAGTAVLLVEQRVWAALSISDTFYVMQHGRLVLDGDTSDAAESEEIIRAYLGA